MRWRTNSRSTPRYLVTVRTWSLCSPGIKLLDCFLRTRLGRVKGSSNIYMYKAPNISTTVHEWMNSQCISMLAILISGALMVDTVHGTATRTPTWHEKCSSIAVTVCTACNSPPKWTCDMMPWALFALSQFRLAQCTRGRMLASRYLVSSPPYNRIRPLLYGKRVSQIEQPRFNYHFWCPCGAVSAFVPLLMHDKTVIIQ